MLIEWTSRFLYHFIAYAFTPFSDQDASLSHFIVPLQCTECFASADKCFVGSLDKHVRNQPLFPYELRRLLLARAVVTNVVALSIVFTR